MGGGVKKERGEEGERRGGTDRQKQIKTENYQDPFLEENKFQEKESTSPLFQDMITLSCFLELVHNCAFASQNVSMFSWVSVTEPSRALCTIKEVSCYSAAEPASS